ncbi:hypothetical protein BS50DRAFT_584452 [Corynespora cassiicola Philippines]|uniref:Uncharacterized protein n=1 Tax=Corynespora cassiicola Philippines TaxID=1448308 RepID=A0A2T2P038_CORCC|nr:hypothetical protein BS50DRAFT_584452 [Corynespora cassiicola Philippines]
MHFRLTRGFHTKGLGMSRDSHPLAARYSQSASPTQNNLNRITTQQLQHNGTTIMEGLHGSTTVSVKRKRDYVYDIDSYPAKKVIVTRSDGFLFAVFAHPSENFLTPAWANSKNTSWHSPTDYQSYQARCGLKYVDSAGHIVEPCEEGKAPEASPVKILANEPDSSVFEKKSLPLGPVASLHETGNAVLANSSGDYVQKEAVLNFLDAQTPQEADKVVLVEKTSLDEHPRKTLRTPAPSVSDVPAPSASTTPPLRTAHTSKSSPEYRFSRPLQKSNNIAGNTNIESKDIANHTVRQPPAVSYGGNSQAHTNHQNRALVPINATANPHTIPLTRSQPVAKTQRGLHSQQDMSPVGSYHDLNHAFQSHTSQKSSYKNNIQTVKSSATQNASYQKTPTFQSPPHRQVSYQRSTPVVEPKTYRNIPRRNPPPVARSSSSVSLSSVSQNVPRTNPVSMTSHPWTTPSSFIHRADQQTFSSPSGITQANSHSKTGSNVPSSDIYSSRKLEWSPYDYVHPELMVAPIQAIQHSQTHDPTFSSTIPLPGQPASSSMSAWPQSIHAHNFYHSDQAARHLTPQAERRSTPTPSPRKIPGLQQLPRHQKPVTVPTSQFNNGQNCNQTQGPAMPIHQLPLLNNVNPERLRNKDGIEHHACRAIRFLRKYPGLDKGFLANNDGVAQAMILMQQYRYFELPQEPSGRKEMKLLKDWPNPDINDKTPFSNAIRFAKSADQEHGAWRFCKEDMDEILSLYLDAWGDRI